MCASNTFLKGVIFRIAQEIAIDWRLNLLYSCVKREVSLSTGGARGTNPILILSYCNLRLSRLLMKFNVVSQTLARLNQENQDLK